MSDSIAKSYNSIRELPSEVRSAFDEMDQKKWMEKYNELLNGNADDANMIEQAREGAWMSLVDAPSSLAVETWATVEVRDADGELVPVDTVAEQADRFIQNGGLMHDSHTNVPVGTVWKWEARTHPETGEKGIVCYFNIYRGSDTFDRARDDILSGRKKAVSIGAEAPRAGYKCDEHGCYTERDVTDLYEISICETPANPEAYFINVGKDIQKSTRDTEVMRLRVKDMNVHEDYTTCPYQKCKRDLQLENPEAEVHFLKKNYHITAKSPNESKLLDSIIKQDYAFRYDIAKGQFDIIPAYDYKDATQEAMANGWACDDVNGRTLLTRKIPKEVFMDWYDFGIIHKVGNDWCIVGDDMTKEGGSMGSGVAGASNTTYSDDWKKE